MHESLFVQELAQEARLLTARESVLRTLALRFGEVSKECAEIIGQLDDLEQLDALHALSIRARRFSQVRNALRRK
jgi:hypothetical protein